MAVFDKIAWLYDPLVRLSSRSRRCAEKIKFVAKLKKSDVVLDIGGGTGLIASFISESVKKISIIDPSKKKMDKSKSDKIQKVYGICCHFYLCSIFLFLLQYHIKALQFF